MDEQIDFAARPVLVEIREVGKTFVMGEVSVEVLRHVSLAVHQGEFMVMVGPSGSGKSTILNILGGMDRATCGELWYAGRNMTEVSDRELTRYRRENIGFVFQFYNLVPNLTARENVMVSTEISRDPMVVEEVLKLVGLGERMDHFPAQLSGGEQQRVAIARAMAKNPDLLLCDEPTGALDFETGKKALRLLVDLNDRLGKTILLITHNVAIAEIAHRVVHLRDGEIASIDVNQVRKPPEEVVW